MVKGEWLKVGQSPNGEWLMDCHNVAMVIG